MKRQLRRRRIASAVPWMFVLVIVGALFVAPSSTGVASLGTLSVTPGSNTYGGQSIRFQGDMGHGEQRIFLQRRGCPTCTWAEVVKPGTGKQFSMLTDPDGRFDFRFPAPAMNGVYFRLHSRQADTNPHLFQTVHQDADMFFVETNPAAVPLPRGLAVVGEPYQLLIDTVRVPSGPKRPTLAGRRVVLQERNESTNEWTFQAEGQLGTDGLVSFPERSPTLGDDGVYRVVLGDWTQGGDAVGSIASLPLYLDVVERPAPVRSLTNLLATLSLIRLTWLKPVTPVDRIIIARTRGAVPNPVRDQIASLPGTATLFDDISSLIAGASYRYAIYTRSADGVYSRVAAEIPVTTPKAG